MTTWAEAATLFAVGVLVDVVGALYYLAVTKERVVLAGIMNFVLIELGYMSYIYVLAGAKLEDNLDKIHWYAAGCGVGTLVGLFVGAWRKRRAAARTVETEAETVADTREKPSRRRGSHRSPRLADAVQPAPRGRHKTAGAIVEAWRRRRALLKAGPEGVPEPPSRVPEPVVA